MSKFYFLVGLWVLCLSSLSAQNRVVGGQVTDGFGFPLAGVSVSLKGGQSGVLTNQDGRYDLDVNEQDVLVFSFIGFDVQEQLVANRTRIDVVLTESLVSLEEMVVVGYGTVKRRDVLGAVATVPESDFLSGNVDSFEKMLVGHAAGLYLSESSAQPGGASSVRIRGVNTIGGSNEPLYVIDGVPMDGFSGGVHNPLSVINPSDVSSVEVLKDASAAAIYGSRAANGVIMVTTRRAQSGDAYVSYSGSYGVEELPSSVDVLSLRDYASFWNERADIVGWGHRSEFSDPDALGQGDDWQDALFEGGAVQNHYLSIANSGENSQTYFSAGYYQRDGIALGSGFERLSARLNIDGQVSSWLKTGSSFTVSQSETNNGINSGSLIANTVGQLPEVNIREEDGSWGGSALEFNKSNPVAEALLHDNRRKTFFVSGNVYADLALSQTLSFRTEAGFNYVGDQGYYFKPTYAFGSTVNADNKSERSTYNTQYWIVKNYFTWNPRLGSRHESAFLLGQEAQETVAENLVSGREGYLNNALTDVSAGDASTATNAGATSESAIASYYGRLNYNYDGRYFLSATYRADGSSKFAAGERWGFFPSVALGWNISGEEFFLYNVPFIEHMKFRFGYGEVGNQNVANYAYGSTLSLVESEWGTGVLTGRLANPIVKWETTRSTNLGMDLHTYRNRLALTVDLYVKETEDLLIQTPLPGYTGTQGGTVVGGVESPWTNGGSIENRGIEVSLRSRNLSTDRFSWETTLTWAANRNKVLSLGSADALVDGMVDGTLVTRSRAGSAVGAIYGYEVMGIFNEAADFYAPDADGELSPVALPAGTSMAKSGVWVGDYIFRDTDSNGVIDENDRTVIGNAEPDFVFGIHNRFTLGAFDLGIQLNGSYGNDVVNMLRYQYENPEGSYMGLWGTVTDFARIALIDDAKPGDDINNVYIENPGQGIARVEAGQNDNQRFSSRFVEDGSYLRIQDLTLGYSLPQSAASRLHLSKLRIYTTVQNLHTFTSYSGYDPAVGAYNQNVLYPGVDNGRFPAARSYSIGLNVTF